MTQKNSNYGVSKTLRETAEKIEIVNDLQGTSSPFLNRVWSGVATSKTPTASAQTHLQEMSIAITWYSAVQHHTDGD